MIHIDNDWKDFFEQETSKNYYKMLRTVLAGEYKSQSILPDMNDIFNAFKLTPLSSIKVVILGQDPYPTKGNPMGLAFSVNENVKIPKSLVNIFKEIKEDVGVEIPINGDLKRWAKQGVFLLNTTLTVMEGKPNSHSTYGWQTFTDGAIEEISKHESPKVFMLWGNNAKSKKSLIDTNRHLVLESVHPSPLSASRGFFGCKHFSKANEFLKQHNIEEIRW